MNPTDSSSSLVCLPEKFGGRLKQARSAANLSQKQLAELVEVSTTSIQQYEAGQVLPKSQYLAAIALCLNVSADFLLFGETKGKSEDETPCQVKPLKGRSDAGVVIHTAKRDYGLVLVPKVKARISAGNGSLETSDEPEGLYAFRETWCLTKGQPGNMVLMEVTGDSMSPAIESGDTVLIDESKKDVIAGAIYAVGIDDEVIVKYVDKLPGKLVLRSENERYTPIEIDLREENTNVRIIGRVIWWCREAR